MSAWPYGLIWFQFMDQVRPHLVSYLVSYRISAKTFPDITIKILRYDTKYFEQYFLRFDVTQLRKSKRRTKLSSATAATALMAGMPRMSQKKKQDALLLPITSPIVDRFSLSFIVWRRSKRAMNWLLKIPPHFKVQTHCYITLRNVNVRNYQYLHQVSCLTITFWLNLWQLTQFD